MILLVLLLLVGSFAVSIWAIWKALGIFEQWTTKAGLTKSSPVFRTLSTLAIASGILGVVVGVRMDTVEGAALALFCWGLSPILGIFFCVASFVRRERPPAIGFLGLLGSLVFIIWRWGL